MVVHADLWDLASVFIQQTEQTTYTIATIPSVVTLLHNTISAFPDIDLKYWIQLNKLNERKTDSTIYLYIAIQWNKTSLIC